MVAFVFACILALVALIGVGTAVIGFVIDEDDAKVAGPVIFLIAGILSGIAFFASGYNTVPTKSIGVVTSYGKVVGQPLTPGFHWLAPWDNVTNISYAIQTDTYLQANGNAIPVRLGGQQEGYADVQIKWRVNPAGANTLFGDYSTQGDITDAVTKYVINPEISNALTSVVGDYNPITDVLSSVNSTSQFTGFSPSLQQKIQADVGSLVTIEQFSLRYIHYDASTQARLNQIQQQQASTAIAQEQYATNVAQAKANQVLAGSTALTPNVLVNDCLNLVASAEKDNYQLPVGFNCFSNSSTLALPAK